MAYARYIQRQTIYRSAQRLLILAALATITFCITVAVISYNPTDPSWLYHHTDAHAITNWCGVWGAHGAALLMYLFGASCLWIVLALIIVMAAVWRSQPVRSVIDRIGAFLLLTLTTAALCNRYAIDFLSSPFPGGYSGSFVHTHLVSLLDEFGALLCLITLSMIGVLIAFRISGRALARAFYYGITHPKLWRIVSKYLTIGISCVGRLLATPCLWSVRACRTVLGHLVLSNQSSADIDYSMLTGHNEHESLDQDPFWDHYKESAPLVSPAPIVEADRVVSIPDQSPAARVDAQYQRPRLSLFTPAQDGGNDAQIPRELKDRAAGLEEKLSCFGVNGTIVAIKQGPVVTLFEYQPDMGTKISKIVALEDDLALALQALSIRIIAPIPGTNVVGFEVANNKRKNVLFADVIQSSAFTTTESALPLVLGKNTSGADVIVDLVKMPHLLIAGSTGSGKSVALNAMLTSLLCSCTPDELKLILIDPKRLEFTAYADIAHLVFPIVTNPKHAVAVLHWVVKEMEERYEQIAIAGARHVTDFNKQVPASERKPYLVIVIDELADLMMTAGREIETLITRIAQMARAAGIHMMVATQRPSVDVITGLIKVNFPSRISFRVTSKIDSRTILDCTGADKLLGKGDMLFLDSTDGLLKRIHGAYVSDKEIAAVIEHIRAQRPAAYHHVMPTVVAGLDAELIDDELYHQVIDFLHEIDEVSISLLQRKFRIGYNRSARIIEILESRGLIMPTEGGKTRKVIR